MRTLACALLVCGIACYGQDGLPELERFKPSLVNKSLNPCDDFYKYTCSNWIAAHPIPDDLPVTSVALPLRIYNQTILRNAMEKAAANPKATGSEKQIGDFWVSCMDEKGRDANGKEWLRAALANIETLKSKRDLPRLLAEFHKSYPAAWQSDDNYTKAPMFGFGPTQDLADASKVVAAIDQGGMALPSVEYYTGAGDRFQATRTKYVAHIQKMLELAGDSSQDAANEAKVVMEMETAFAKAAMDNVTRRDPEKIYNKRSLQQLEAAVPSFGWKDYLKRMNAPEVPFYIVSAPPFLEALEAQIKSRSIEEWRSYFRWWTVQRAAPYLGSEFEKASFAFFGTALSGTPQMQPQWRRCVQSADALLGEALGQAYVNIAFPPESKERANQLVRQVREALTERIRRMDWMADQTKKQAMVKQDSTLQKIGYPDRWIDYGTVKVLSGNYLANLHAATAFESHRQIAKIGKPVNRQEWSMTPATINAYEDPQLNTINFPAGILQYPFFGSGQDDASNLGAIGMVIGHEAIHGFDDQGRKFDEKGNLRDWWTAEDAKRYEEKDKCIIDQYSQEIPEYGVKQKGELTAGEDTADNGGMNLALLALENVYKARGKSLDQTEDDGLTARQRFFLSYAFSWCSDVRPEAARNQVITNPHSLARFRVNRPLSNMPEFQKAFGCSEGQQMVHAPACRVW
ncbi:MAG: M13 family metallopeptidase [Bryobacteraceae bacterium]